MTRVLWISHVYPRDASDLQGLFLHRLARELPPRGVAVRVLAPGAADAPESADLDGVEIRRFRYPGQDRSALAYTGEMHKVALRHPVQLFRFVRRMIAAVPREVASFRPDVVHAHWWFPGGLAAAAQKPFVLSLHGTDVRILSRSLLPWPLARRVISRADRVLPVSGAIARELSRLRLSSGPFDILPMPADADVFRPVPLDRERISFVVPARLVAQKRVDVALRALAGARRRGADATLEVVGEGDRRSALERLTGELGLSEVVRFHGFVSQAELARLYRAARAVVLTSRDEGYGLVLVEAGLSARPSVGVRSGGIEELVADGETGRLVEPDDERALEDALVELARDADRATAFGEAARERALPRTARPLADRLAQIYDEVLGRSRASRTP